LPELHLIAGPNGSGKSTFTREVHAGARSVGYDIPTVINPDAIAQKLRPDDPDAAAAPAAREALRQRAEALAKGESFSIETTLSGKSEQRLIDDARAAGYRVTMTYVALDSADRNVDRVNLRAEEEGRTVPAADVRRRYERSLDALRGVVGRIDTVHVFENSARNFEHVATLERGRVIAMADHIPAWVERALGLQLEVARDRAAVAQDAHSQLRGTKASILTPTIRERPVMSDAVLTGRVLATGREHIAIAMSGHSFGIVERAVLDRTPAAGEEIRITLREGRGFVEAVDRSRDARERDR